MSLWVCASSLAQSTSPGFQPLPGLGLPGEQTGCQGLSHDGRVAMGSIRAEGIEHLVVWRDGVIHPLATNGTTGLLYDISGDGRVIVGRTFIGSTFRASVWEYVDGIYQQYYVGDLPGGGEHSGIRAISRDGARAIGVARSVAGRVQAATWDIADGPGAPAHGLGYVPPWNTDWSEGNAISADGSIVAGTGRKEVGEMAFSTRLGELAAEPGAYGIEAKSSIASMSADGRFMVGFSRANGAGTLNEPTLWVDGVSQLLPLPFSATPWGVAYAIDVTDDGSIITGTGRIGSTWHSVVWVDGEPLYFRDYFDSLDLLPNGWQLVGARVIGDGQSFFGRAINPDGQEQAFVARVPTPGTMGIVVVTFGLFVRRRGRRGRRPGRR